MKSYSKIFQSIQPELLIIILLSVSLVLTNNILLSQTHPLDEKFDEYVANTLLDWEVPGVVISVVKNGNRVFTKGYGTCKLGENLLPDKNTLVTVASLTKAFTAAAMAILVDEKKLTWDTPIKKYIPEYQFSDDYVTHNTTVRDLLTHRVGLPSEMLGGLNNPEYTIENLLLDLRTSEPSTGFRERLNYSNINYALAGEVVARLSGMSWNEFITQRILNPLGMSSTYATPSRLKQSLGDPNDIDNIFIRAIKKEGKIVSNEWSGYDYLYAPAASIITTGVDIAKWMILQLQEGKYEGRHILSTEAIKEMRNPQTVEDIQWAKVHDSWWKDVRNHFSPLIAYGLGWWSFDYKSIRIDEHWGGGAGSTVLAIMSGEDLAVFVTANADYPNWVGNQMVDALKLKIIDLFINAPDTDWSKKFLAVHKRKT